MSDTYAAARVHCMRTKLISGDNYERLLKMGESEIINFLHTTEYKEDIDKLAIKDFENLELIDRVIANNTQREYEKLEQISREDFKKALNKLLEQNDIWNMKVIADAIAGNKDAKEALKSYGRKGTFDATAFSQAKTIEELSNLAAAKMSALRSKPTTLAAFRDVLQKKKQWKKPLLAQKYLIDEVNITTLLLLKREKMQPDQIMKRLARGGTVPIAKLREAATAENFSDALKILRTTKYSQVIEGAQENAIVHLEAELHNDIMKRIRKLSLSAPMHADILLRYIIEKEIEHENIRVLVKGKRLGLDESFIRKHIA